MGKIAKYDVLSTVIKPEKGIDVVGNEYEEDVQICLGSEVQGYCFVGRGTWLNNATIYGYSQLGRYCSIARGAAIGAPDHLLTGVTTAISFADIGLHTTWLRTEVGHDVWVGANATVIAGVKIGHGAAIAANAVVTKDVRPYALVAGVPAREVRRRFDDATCDALVDSAWWELPPATLKDLPLANVYESLRQIRDYRAAQGRSGDGAHERLGKWLQQHEHNRDVPAKGGGMTHALASTFEPLDPAEERAIELESALDVVASEAAKLRAELAARDGRLVELETALVSTQAASQELHERVMSQGAELSALRERIAFLEPSFAASMAETAGLSSQLASARSRVEELEPHIPAAAAAAAALRDQLAAKEGHVAVLGSSLDASIADGAQLRDRLSVGYNRIAELEAALHSHDAAFDRLIEFQEHMRQIVDVLHIELGTAQRAWAWKLDQALSQLLHLSPLGLAGGKARGANLPSRFRAFDERLYLDANPDVAAARFNPLLHWVIYGRGEERRGERRNHLSPWFAERPYLSEYPDVEVAVRRGIFASGAEHWLLVGRDEIAAGRRSPLAGFDQARHLAGRPDVVQAIQLGTYASALDHWLQIGSHEERAA